MPVFHVGACRVAAFWGIDQGGVLVFSAPAREQLAGKALTQGKIAGFPGIRMAWALAQIMRSGTLCKFSIRVI
jgi:hypothetical protein